MTAALTVIRPGMLTSVQDLGRWGHQASGVPVAGPMDEYSHRPIYKLFMSHPTFDEYWKSYSLKGKYEQIEAPALCVTGWYDNLVHEMFKCYAGWKGRTAAWINLAGFGAMTFNFFVVNIVISGLHSYAGLN